MFKTVAVRALLGVGALGVTGGSTAFAAAPAVGAAVQAATSRGASKNTPAEVRHGVVVKTGETELTIRERGKSETTFTLTAQTQVRKAGSPAPLGRDAIKAGERVRVRFAENEGKKVASRVVLLLDARAGRVVGKTADSFVVRTREHGDVKVTISDRTRFFTGRGKARQAGSFAALKVGDRVVVRGEEDSAHNFDAARVRYNDVPPGRAVAPGAPAAG
jgi:hypothetical protein